MARKRRGPIAKAIERLWYSFKGSQISEAGFRRELEVILKDACFKNVGLVIQRLSIESNDQRIWGLADQVDPKIRQAYQHWRGTMLHRGREIG